MRYSHLLRRSSLLLGCAALLASCVGVQAAREEQLLASGWRFIRQDAAPDADSSAWEAVSIPHCWNAAEVDRGKAGNPDLPYGYYRGPGTYELSLAAPAAWRGHRVFVQFEAASVTAKVWLNGHALGEHRGGFTAFCFELTPYLQIEGRNTLRVRVDNSPNDAIPPLSGDFNVCGGIYRPVHLLVTDPVCITPLEYGAPGVYVRQGSISLQQAQVEVEARLSNHQESPADVGVDFRIKDASGAVVARGHADATVPSGAVVPAVQHLTVPTPHRWQGRQDPYLYSVEVSVIRGGNAVDTVTQPLGIRTLAITQDRGVLLNGRPYPIYGVNRHQDLQGKGWASSDADHDRDFGLIAEMGATAVRLAHYPQAFHVYDLADRMGLLLWNEISLVDYVRTTPEFAANAEQQLREMILQRCNHPSVLCWGLFNELRAPDAAAGLDLIRHLNAVAKALDPSRPTVCASNLMSRQPIHTVTDWVAFNAYPGWYGNVAKDTMATFLEKRQAELDGKRIAISEYGAGGSPNQHEEGVVKRPVTNSRWHPEEWQAQVHEQDWRDICANQQRLWGTFLWSMFDFAAAKRNEGEHTGMNDKGMVTRDRSVRKDVFFFYKANWTTNPLVYITSRRLVTRTQPVTAIKVYSNCDSVELVVNGRSMGTVRPDAIRIARWPAVTLAPGPNEIIAIGRRAKAEVRDTCAWVLKAASPVTTNASFPDTHALAIR